MRRIVVPAMIIVDVPDGTDICDADALAGAFQNDANAQGRADEHPIILLDEKRASYEVPVEDDLPHTVRDRDDVRIALRNARNVLDAGLSRGLWGADSSDEEDSGDEVASVVAEIDEALGNQEG